MIATDFEIFGKVSFLFEYASLIFVQKNTMFNNYYGSR